MIPAIKIKHPSTVHQIPQKQVDQMLKKAKTKPINKQELWRSP